MVYSVREDRFARTSLFEHDAWARCHDVVWHWTVRGVLSVVGSLSTPVILQCNTLSADMTKSSVISFNLEMFFGLNLVLDFYTSAVFDRTISRHRTFAFEACSVGSLISFAKIMANERLV